MLTHSACHLDVKFWHPVHMMDHSSGECSEGGSWGNRHRSWVGKTFMLTDICFIRLPVNSGWGTMQIILAGPLLSYRGKKFPKLKQRFDAEQSLSQFEPFITQSKNFPWVCHHPHLKVCVEHMESWRIRWFKIHLHHFEPLRHWPSRPPPQDHVILHSHGAVDGQKYRSSTNSHGWQEVYLQTRSDFYR